MRPRLSGLIPRDDEAAERKERTAWPKIRGLAAQTWEMIPASNVPTKPRNNTNDTSLQANRSSSPFAAT